jgi:hypothetical protein
MWRGNRFAAQKLRQPDFTPPLTDTKVTITGNKPVRLRPVANDPEVVAFLTDTVTAIQ